MGPCTRLAHPTWLSGTSRPNAHRCSHLPHLALTSLQLPAFLFPWPKDRAACPQDGKSQTARELFAAATLGGSPPGEPTRGVNPPAFPLIPPAERSNPLQPPFRPGSFPEPGYQPRQNPLLGSPLPNRPDALLYGLAGRNDPGGYPHGSPGAAPSHDSCGNTSFTRPQQTVPLLYSLRPLLCKSCNGSHRWLQRALYTI